MQAVPPGLRDRLHRVLPGGVARRAGAASASASGPWRLALRRLRRSRTSLAFLAVFVVLVGTAAAAPLWKEAAGRGPLANNLTGTVEIAGEPTDVVALDGVPIGPTWRTKYLLGADENGRDIMVRLLYGARNSLLIGIGAALATMVAGLIVGMVAGFFRGWVDAVIRTLLDAIWAFPVVLLGIALGVALALGGLAIGPIAIAGDSTLIPIAVIAAVYVPYVARPIRGEVLALREREFVEAARAQGAGPLRTMFSEILPNLSSTIVVFFPIMVANAILLEAALSFLGAGVRPPEPSWGNMIDDGVERIVTAPHLAIAPGLMLVLTVLSLNVFGDGVRDAFDPKAKVRAD